MTRRLDKKLRKFFEEKQLTTKERSFIDGCLRCQSRHPQLTNRQWEIILEIYNLHVKGD